MPTAHETLGVSNTASEAEIRSRYLQLVREFAPDRAPERFAEIRAAYDELRDPRLQLETAVAESEHERFSGRVAERTPRTIEPRQVAHGGAAHSGRRTMNDEDAEHDERILDQFRTWLQETRQESRAASPEAESTTNDVSALAGFGLERLVEEFTALRHELKLQTRGVRGLEDVVQASLETLADAATTFRSASTQVLAEGAQTADKNFATALAELDEALDRGREQWKKNGERLIGPTASPALARARELYAGLSWWQRRRTAGYHQRVCGELERTNEHARRERQTLLLALLSGYELTPTAPGTDPGRSERDAHSHGRPDRRSRDHGGC